jgi:hypothetical protein
MTDIEKVRLAAFLAGVIALVIYHEWRRPRFRPHLTHRRGAKLVTREKAQALATAAGHGPYTPPEGFLGLYFGGVFLPFHFAFTGFLWIGAIGSGKTLTFVPFLRSVLDLVARRGSRARLCLYDPKREFSRLVFATLPPHIPVYRLNFMDRRSVFWDLAKDFRTPAELFQLAAFLFRAASKNEIQPYFRKAGHALFYAVLLAVVGLAWKLSDIPVIFGSLKRLRFMLNRTPEGRAAAAFYLSAESGLDVLATIASQLHELQLVAACSRHAQTSFSVRQFMNEQGVVLLELVDSVSEIQKPFYQLFVRKLSDDILLRANADSPTVVALDELFSLGEIDLLPLTTKGRSSGAVVAATVMSLPALEESLGGAAKAKALLDTLQSQSFTRIDAHETAESCSKLVGEEEVEEVTISVSNPTDPPNRPRTLTEQPKVTYRRLVTADEIKTLPTPDFAGGTVAGVFRLKDVGAYYGRVPFRDGFPPIAETADVSEFDERPAEEMRLPAGFTAADLARLKIEDTPKTRALFGVK